MFAMILNYSSAQMSQNIRDFIDSRLPTLAIAQDDAKLQCASWCPSTQAVSHTILWLIALVYDDFERLHRTYAVTTSPEFLYTYY